MRSESNSFLGTLASTSGSRKHPLSSTTLPYCNIGYLTDLRWYFIPLNTLSDGYLERFERELAHHHGQDVPGTDPAPSIIIIMLIFPRVPMTPELDVT